MRYALIGLAMSAGPAVAQDTQLHIFAGCTGRISAQMEHAWLMNDARAEELADLRLTFVGILEAIMPADQARDTLNHRIEVKRAHSAMLTTASFGTDPRRAKIAQRTARIKLDACRDLLLDS